jgi:hypothetical protein
MSESASAKLVGGLLIAGLIFAAFFWPHTFTWDGDGEIDVFPSTESVKNYRLDATMTVTLQRNGWFGGHEEYTDITGSWPNGGTLELSDCTVSQDSRAECTDQDDTSYGVEVVTPPERPEADSYDDDSY